MALATKPWDSPAVRSYIFCAWCNKPTRANARGDERFENGDSYRWQWTANCGHVIYSLRGPGERRS